jgi:hypothetical protein
MRFARFLATSFLALLVAPGLVVTAQTTPHHASSKPVVRRPVAHKATTPPGNTHYKHGHPVATPGARKHHKLL